VWFDLLRTELACGSVFFCAANLHGTRSYAIFLIRMGDDEGERSLLTASVVNGLVKSALLNRLRWTGI
jgi:hypothetical protein